MSDGFTEMIDAANQFFVGLAANNSKEWFEPRKAQYSDEIRKPAELMADILADDMGRAVGQVLQSKVFRIHRDVRFSKDKTPYKAHLHMMWSCPQVTPVLFFGVESGKMIVGCGVMGFEGEQLMRYRQMVDAKGEALAALIGAGRLSDHGPEPLKRVPAPFSADHPQGALLRRKNLIVTRAMHDGWRGNVVKAIGQEVAPLLPLYQFLKDI